MEKTLEFVLALKNFNALRKKGGSAFLNWPNFLDDARPRFWSPNRHLLRSLSVSIFKPLVVNL